MTAGNSSCGCGRISRSLTRREALTRFGGGLAAIAAQWLLARPLRAAAPAQVGLGPGFPCRAKNVIFVFMGGGPSHMDLFDPKPELGRRHGEPMPGSITQRKIGGSTRLMASPFEFARHGTSGIELSSLLPHLARHVDDIALIRSGVTSHIDHGEALLAMHTGRGQSGFPTLGSWVTYALGTENADMPAYVALAQSDPERTRNATTSAFLPARFQGAPIDASGGTPIFDLVRPESVGEADQRRMLELTQALNRRHALARGGAGELEDRIGSFELAARMQVAALGLVDTSRETEATRRLYGLDRDTTRVFGSQCLTARRLIEGGVRFVHLIRNDWDHHGKLKEKLAQSCAETDQPVAGLLADLKARGLLETTLVIWAGEFGRLPVIEGSDGRDHNPYGFSFWLAGAGVRAGTTYGKTDDFGYAAVEDPVTMADFHATVLHLLGLDHTKVRYPFDGRDESLTGVEPARVVEGVLS